LLLELALRDFLGVRLLYIPTSEVDDSGTSVEKNSAIFESSPVQPIAMIQALIFVAIDELLNYS
jgi:hypothetical protein